ncbi:MAG: iron-sulfur cluster assembly protein [Verrucomicrobiia bacterium]
MSDDIPLQPHDQVTFARDCEVTQIPSGNRVTISSGTTATVTQMLGGHVTLEIFARGIMAQLAGKDLNALLKNGKPVVTAAPAITPAAKGNSFNPADEKAVWEALKACYDPEIPVNIVDLGLVYDVRLLPLPSGQSRVEVKMTLTAMGCGMGPVIADQARNALLNVAGVGEADVQIVWDPPWNQSMISETGKKLLGLW